MINDSYQIQGGSASSWKYFDMSMELPNKGMLIAYFAMLAKIDNQIGTGASLILAGEEAFSQVKAIAVDLSKNITSPANGGLISLENILSTTGIAFKEITEEEFYNLDNGGNSLIEFTINGTPYQAEEGMTWGEFVESEYNNGDFETVEWEIDEPIKFIYYKGRQLKIEGGDDKELLTNKINSNGVYYYNALG